MNRRLRKRQTAKKKTLALFLLVGLLTISIPFLLGRVTLIAPKKTPMINLWREDLGKIVSMSLEDYVRGVVAAEMPASFELEALKAQAIASRTYAFRRIYFNERVAEHPEAHFTTDFRTGQAYATQEELKRKWGPIGYYTHWAKITQAVSDTRGMIAVYKEEPILAVYHSTSGGRTENSEHYWSLGLPYLRSIPDPYGQHSPYAFTVREFSREELLQKMQLSLFSPPRIVERFPSGRVKTFEMGGVWFTGREVRLLLDLPSTWFSVEQKDTIRFSLWGYGHGVGLSQYGADGMASKGYDYREILQYYYQGIRITVAY